MFNLLNDLSHSIYLFKGECLPISFARSFTWDSLAFSVKYFNKFYEQLAANFFDFDIWKDRFTQINSVLSRANPFPDGIFVLFKNRYRSINVFFDMPNQIGHHIKTRYSRGESDSSRIEFGRSVFITTKIPISIQKTSKPFKELLSGLKVRRNFNQVNSFERRSFTGCNLRNIFTSRISSIFSCLVNVGFQKKQLLFLKKGVRFNLFDEVRNIWSKTSPRIDFFSIFSFIIRNRSSKSRVEKIYDFFITHLKRNDLSSLKRKRNMAFCIEYTSEIIHKTPVLLASYILTKHVIHLQRLNVMT